MNVKFEESMSLEEFKDNVDNSTFRTGAVSGTVWTAGGKWSAELLYDMPVKSVGKEDGEDYQIETRIGLSTGHASRDAAKEALRGLRSDAAKAFG